MLGMVGFYWKIYKTAVAATEAYKRGVVEQKTSGLSSSTSDNALCIDLRSVTGSGPKTVGQGHKRSKTQDLCDLPLF